MSGTSLLQRLCKESPPPPPTAKPTNIHSAREFVVSGGNHRANGGGGEKATVAVAPAGVEGGGGGGRVWRAEVVTEPELLAVLQELAVGDEVTIKITKASRGGEEERVGEKATATDQDKLTSVSENYESDKRDWIAFVKALAKDMEQEQALSSLEEHDYANSIPDFLMESVRALVAQTEDLNMKYNEQVAKNRELSELSNIIRQEEAKAKAKGKWPAEF